MIGDDAVRVRITQNLQRVRERMARAADRAHRSLDSIRLLGVTKYSSIAETRLLFEAGCHDLAESRPQDLWDKAKELVADDLRWHFIGHMQRNKVRRSLPLLYMLHSLDSERLLLELESEAARINRRLKVLLEVNISGDETKTGLAPTAVEDVLEKALASPHIELCGLMGMAGLGSDNEAARPCFERLRELRDRLQTRYQAANLGELSMGMSGDFEAAIEEGSTLIRVGSALFEGEDSQS